MNLLKTSKENFNQGLIVDRNVKEKSNYLTRENQVPEKSLPIQGIMHYCWRRLEFLILNINHHMI